MDNTRQIKEYLAALEHMSKFFKNLLEEEKAALSGPASEREKLSELTDLRMLAKSDLWPKAVPTSLIADDESQKSRAMGIIHEFLNTPLSNKKFLDFGCGEGHTVSIAQEIFGAKAFGYDIKSFDCWATMKKTVVLSDELKPIYENAPYDVILLYDVLDHSENPEEILKICKALKSENGKIYLRLHPWTARSGTHLYKSLNKAYLQLVFNSDELATLGVIQDKTKKINNMQEYKDWIINAGLTIQSENYIRQDIELFFTHNPAILRRIKSNFNYEFPRKWLEIQFIDLILV